MIAHKKTLLSIAVVMALTACGGGGGGGGVAAVPAPTTSAGKAVDGYLSGALVVCDTNNNGVKDGAEISATTNATGDFTFTSACASTIVVSGGTNIDTGLAFKGILKAPAGSTVATPLTSLMVSGGLTAVQVATALGLPATTDVSKVDPTTNADLYKKTVAMQQIIQQVADTLGGLAQDNSPAAIQAIYSQVAKAVVSTLVANPSTPLVGATGIVAPALVATIVKTSVDNVAAATDTALVTAKAGISTYSATSVSELVSAAVATQATTLAQVADVAALITAAATLQENSTIANAATQMATLLTIAADTASVNLTTAGTALQQLTDTVTSNDADATAAVAAEVTTQATNAGITAPTVDVATFAAATNYLSMTGDAITFDSTPYTLAEFQSSAGVTLAALPATVSLTYALNGTPIPTSGSEVKLGLEIKDVNSTRVLQVIIDQIILTPVYSSTPPTMTVVVPAGATMIAYGKTSSASATLPFTNVSANSLITSSGNILTLNTSNILAKLAAEAAGTPFANLLNVRGTFTMKVVISNLNFKAATSTTAVRSDLKVAVTGSTQEVSGLGFEGKFTY